MTALRKWIDGNRGPAILAAALIAVAAIAMVSLVWWDWVRGEDSNSAALRNVGLLAAVPTSLLLAVWRNSIAQRQADIALQGHLNERYQQGVELLAHDSVMVRTGAIHALHNLALESPQDHRPQIVELLCAFVRHPPHAETGDDIAHAVRAAASCTQGWSVELIESPFRLDFHGANLAGADLLSADLVDVDLREANLTGADLRGAMLFRAILLGADLTDADLTDAALEDAYLHQTIIHGANLRDAILTSCHFSIEIPSDSEVDERIEATVRVGNQRFRVARGLTQAQLDKAVADPDNPPILTGMVDADSGSPLEWRGRPAPF